MLTEEDDSDKALKTIDELEETAKRHSGLKIQIAAHPSQLTEAEADLMNTVTDLKSHNRIFEIHPLLMIFLTPLQSESRKKTPTVHMKAMVIS